MSRNFPHWLKAYCSFTAASEAPLEFHFWTGVSTIAAVLKRRVWRDELIFKWTPNFYIILVGPAGVVQKSTSVNIGYQLLRRVKDLKGQNIVDFGPDSMTWQGLGTRFEKAAHYESYLDPNGVDQKILMAPLTCSVSELGTFLRPGDSELVSFLTDIWDGKERPFDHGTARSGNIIIENPWLNVIAATTPDWLQDHFPASLLGQGIGSRIIFVYGDKKRHLTAHPSRAVRPQDYYLHELQLIEDLTAISRLGGPYDATPDAFLWSEDWYTKHNSSRPTHTASARYGGYLARKQTHLWKLAMVLAASQRDNLIIERRDLEEAELILASSEQSMIKVFESVGIVDEAKYVAEVVQFVRAHGWIAVNDLYYQHCHNIMSEQDFKRAIRQAVEGSLLDPVTRNNTRGVSPRAVTKH